MIWSASIGRKIYTNKHVSKWVGVWGEILLRILHVKSGDQTRSEILILSIGRKIYTNKYVSNCVGVW